MKKIWTLLLAVLMIFTLAACGGGSESANESDTEETLNETADVISENTEDGSELSSEETSFADVLTDSEDLDNYYYELIVETPGVETQDTKMWVMGQKMKMETAGQIMYYDFAEGTVASYTEETNQLIVMSVGDTGEMETPFSVEDDIDSSTYDFIYYQGTEELDGKTVYVYDYSVDEYSVKYYIWADTGIILKMETDSDGYESSYYFKDLAIDCVTESDLEYPAGASVINMGG